MGDHVEAARRARYSEKTLNNQACRLKRELDTGERMNISEYIANAVLERLKRDRAET